MAPYTNTQGAEEGEHVLRGSLVAISAPEGRRMK
jgi:hypothetical protein